MSVLPRPKISGQSCTKKLHKIVEVEHLEEANSKKQDSSSFGKSS